MKYMYGCSLYLSSSAEDTLRGFTIQKRTSEIPDILADGAVEDWIAHFVKRERMFLAVAANSTILGACAVLLMLVLFDHLPPQAGI